MITGIVTAEGEGRIHVSVRGPMGSGDRVEAVIDTGYNGWLSLSPSFIRRLELPWQECVPAVLADGSEVPVNVYEGTVIWDRRRRSIPIDEADGEPLVGMALLSGFELTMQVCTGGEIRIKALA